jgi:NADPH:quinone reductase-like Zn-dependent oxidoreductase
MQGVTCGSLEDFHDMLAAIEQADLHPVISAVFPFAEAKAAFVAMQKNAFFGKIVIDVADR